MPMGAALTGLTDHDLENLLRAIHRKQFVSPISSTNLALSGLSYLHDKVDFLQGMDEATVRAVVVAVLAERRKR